MEKKEVQMKIALREVAETSLFKEKHDPERKLDFRSCEKKVLPTRLYLL